MTGLKGNRTWDAALQETPTEAHAKSVAKAVAPHLEELRGGGSRRRLRSWLAAVGIGALATAAGVAVVFKSESGREDGDRGFAEVLDAGIEDQRFLEAAVELEDGDIEVLGELDVLEALNEKDFDNS